MQKPEQTFRLFLTLKTNFMKKIVLVLASLLFVGSLSISCSEDPEPTPIYINDGDYWIRGYESFWTYRINGTETEEYLKISSVDEINGEQYRLLYPTFTGEMGIQRLRVKNGNYYVRTDDFTNADQTISGYEVTFLKDYLAIGQTWTDNYTQTKTDVNGTEILNYEITSMIESRSFSFMMLDRDFRDVIKIKRVIHITGNGVNNTKTSYYWFAKNMGPIKIEADGTTKELYTWSLNGILNN